MTSRGWRRKALPVAIAAALALASPFAPGLFTANASASGPPNAVITWNLNAQTAIWDVAGQQPQVQARSFAMVHGAIYDAVNAIAGTPYQPYVGAPPANGSESTDAAIGTAAFRVLNSMFPDQHTRLQAQYD